MDAATLVILRSATFVGVLPVVVGAALALASKGQAEARATGLGLVFSALAIVAFSGISGALILPPVEAADYVPLAMGGAAIGAGFAVHRPWVGPAAAGVALSAFALAAFAPLRETWGDAVFFGVAVGHFVVGLGAAGAFSRKASATPESLTGLALAAGTGALATGLTGSAKLAQQQGALSALLFALIGTAWLLRRTSVGFGLRQAAVTGVVATLAAAYVYVEVHLGIVVALGAAALTGGLWHPSAEPGTARARLSRVAVALVPVCIALGILWATYEPDPYAAYY